MCIRDSCRSLLPEHVQIPVRSCRSAPWKPVLVQIMDAVKISVLSVHKAVTSTRRLCTAVRRSQYSYEHMIPRVRRDFWRPRGLQLQYGAPAPYIPANTARYGPSNHGNPHQEDVIAGLYERRVQRDQPRVEPRASHEWPRQLGGLRRIGRKSRSIANAFFRLLACCCPRSSSDGGLRAVSFVHGAQRFQQGVGVAVSIVRSRGVSRRDGRRPKLAPACR